MSGMFCPMFFLLRVLLFQVLGVDLSSILSLYIYVCTHIYIYMVLDKGPSSFFCVWLSSFPSAICCKDCFFPLNGLQTLVRDHLTMYMRVYFRLSLPLVSVCLCASTIPFLDHSFIVSFEIRTCKFSSFISTIGFNFFQQCFVVSIVQVFYFLIK